MKNLLSILNDMASTVPLRGDNRPLGIGLVAGKTRADLKDIIQQALADIFAMKHKV